MNTIEETPCPSCGEKTLRIEFKMTIKPIGTFSLAGAQMKFSSRMVPWLICGNCGIKAEGHMA